MNSVAQKYQRYYDYAWKPCDNIHARYISVMEKKGDLWSARDYYLRELKLQGTGHYTDTSAKVKVGEFRSYFLDGSLAGIEHYKDGKKDGTFLHFFPGGKLKDSAVYHDDMLVGTRLEWYSNGQLRDSVVVTGNGSSTLYNWLDNGTLSSTGFRNHGRRDGTWQYYHSNGRRACTEVYEDGNLRSTSYFDELGNPQTDTSNVSRKPTFHGGHTAWLKHLKKYGYFPEGYRIKNASEAVVVLEVTVDEEGNVGDIQVLTPLHPAFDEMAVNVLRKSPRWLPAIHKNRRIKTSVIQHLNFRDLGH